MYNGKDSHINIADAKKIKIVLNAFANIEIAMEWVRDKRVYRIPQYHWSRDSNGNYIS